jgi:deoxyribose-phosphate aldolase
MSIDVKKILSLIDLTSLNDEDNAEKISQLCQLAENRIGQVAAVCVYPQFVSQVKQALQNQAIKIVTVANFPQGSQVLEKTLKEIEIGIANGANEIDVVMPYTHYLAGERQWVIDYMSSCRKKIASKYIMKVILESGSFVDLDLLNQACEDMIAVGVDFLKTSTGKSPKGATLSAVEIILNAIQNTNPKVGCKVSGGIQNRTTAEEYIALAENIMGTDWVNASHFRIGASRLVTELLA